MFEDDNDQQYHVVRNHEEQYSIWPVEQPLPLGWETQDFTGHKAGCLEHIARVWTDMRPKSLRDQMGG
jgi:MbtH protein